MKTIKTSAAKNSAVTSPAPAGCVVIDADKLQAAGFDVDFDVDAGKLTIMGKGRLNSSTQHCFDQFADDIGLDEADRIRAFEDLIDTAAWSHIKRCLQR